MVKSTHGSVSDEHDPTMAYSSSSPGCSVARLTVFVTPIVDCASGVTSFSNEVVGGGSGLVVDGDDTPGAEGDDATGAVVVGAGAEVVDAVDGGDDVEVVSSADGPGWV
jgi:hypothetical protein